MTTTPHCDNILITMSNTNITTTATITLNWQLHIPVKIRQAIGLKNHGKVQLETKDDQIIITKQKPQDDIMSIVGSLKKEYKKNPIDIDNIRDHIDYSDL